MKLKLFQVAFFIIFFSSSCYAVVNYHDKSVLLSLIDRFDAKLEPSAKYNEFEKKYFAKKKYFPASITTKMSKRAILSEIITSTELFNYSKSQLISILEGVDLVDKEFIQALVRDGSTFNMSNFAVNDSIKRYARNVILALNDAVATWKDETMRSCSNRVRKLGPDASSKDDNIQALEELFNLPKLDVDEYADRLTQEFITSPKISSSKTRAAKARAASEPIRIDIKRRARLLAERMSSKKRSKGSHSGEKTKRPSNEFGVGPGTEEQETEAPESIEQQISTQSSGISIGTRNFNAWYEMDRRDFHNKFLLEVKKNKKFIQHIIQIDWLIAREKFFNYQGASPYDLFHSLIKELADSPDATINPSTLRKIATRLQHVLEVEIKYFNNVSSNRYMRPVYYGDVKSVRLTSAPWRASIIDILNSSDDVNIGSYPFYHWYQMSYEEFCDAIFSAILTNTTKTRSQTSNIEAKKVVYFQQGGALNRLYNDTFASLHSQIQAGKTNIDTEHLQGIARRIKLFLNTEQLSYRLHS